MIIYKIENKINGKIYVGQTKYSLKKRIATHMNANFYIGKALRKYGLESFVTSIIDKSTTREGLNEKEKNWIRFFDCKAPDGYNFTDGGDGIDGYIHTEETKEKIGKGNKGKLSWRKGTGKIKSKPMLCLCGCGGMTKAGNKYICGHNTRGISPPNKGKHHSEETKQKIREACIGWKHTEEAKKKISEARKGKKFTQGYKAKLSATCAAKRLQVMA